MCPVIPVFLVFQVVEKDAGSDGDETCSPPYPRVQPMAFKDCFVVEAVGDSVRLDTSSDHLMIDLHCQSWTTQLNTLLHDDTIADLEGRKGGA